MLALTRFISTGLLALLLAACASQPPAPTVEETSAEVAEYIATDRLRDERGRFREIFCTVLEARGDDLPDYRDCADALKNTGAEGGATGAPVVLGEASSDPLYLIVPGLGWECFAEWLDVEYSASVHVAQYGYEMRLIPVAGLSSSAHNAAQIREFVAALPPEDRERPLILVGYSKGTPDILEALVAYPELAAQTTAVLSLAGSVKGSPLADEASQDQANLLTHVPGSECEVGDEGAVESLRTDVRQSWLAENPLPDNIRYYSVATYPDPERVSWVLRNSYKALSGVDPRNDTQVLVYDQLIPASTLVGFVNADHWAIAVPVDRKHPFIGSTLVNHNAYPREAMLEALMRYLEEDLNRPR